MQLKAVLIGRVLGFVELATLNPQGRIFFPDIVSGIVGRFNFQKYPTTHEEFDESKGIEFHDGQWDGINVPKLTIYNNGFLVDTQASTAVSEQVLMASLDWAKEAFGITFSPEMIYRRRYLSDLLVSTDVPILDGFKPINNLRQSLSDSMDAILGERLPYAGIRLDVDFERFQRQAAIAPLTIQRRLDYAFSDNHYYSEAPLPTERHFDLLEQYEKDVLGSLSK
jgi:hypothetical protein